MNISPMFYTPGTLLLLLLSSVRLEWDANPPEDNVAGYNMYRSESSGAGYIRLNVDLIPGTTYTDNTLDYGDQVYYVCTAVNYDDLESGFSNEVSYESLPCLGDANLDGTVNILDVLKIHSHIVEVELLTGHALDAADANQDGTVNILDVLRIHASIVGSNPLPCH